MKRVFFAVLSVVVVALLAMAFIPLPASTVSISFTRFLHIGPDGADAKSGVSDRNTEFSATPGTGLLTLKNDCPEAARSIASGSDRSTSETSVRLNGETFNVAEQPHPVTLLADNKVQLPTAAENCLSVRVTQIDEVTMHVLSRVHFNTNVSSFKKAREFYGALGFETLSGFPDTNTQAMARAIGVETPTDYDGSKGDFAGGYLLHGELVGPKGFGGGVIDLIEFTVPRDESPPYAQLNHLGMTRGVMHTSNLDADVEYFKTQNISMLSDPVERADGSRFVIFSDLDGTQYELRQSAGQITGEEKPNAKTHISALGAVAVNVSDHARSSAWYQMLGYEVTTQLPSTESTAVAKAMGFSEPWEIVGSEVTHSQDGSTLELVEWRSPRDLTAPYALPVNHLGMHRMAFSTSDIEADVATLRAQGVSFVSPITPCCSGDDSWGAIVAFFDPDGTVLELVEQPVMTPLLTLSMRLAALTGS